MGVVIALLLWICCVAEAWAANEDIPATAADAMKKTERFSLWNNCQPVDLFVLYASPVDNSLISSRYSAYPSHKSIDTTLQRRLRAARIYRESKSLHGRLTIKIDPLIESKLGFMVGDKPLSSDHSFATFSFTFHKKVVDPLTELSGTIDTWRYDGWARAERLYEKVSGTFDYFIDQYLRVNEPACREK